MIGGPLGLREISPHGENKQPKHDTLEYRYSSLSILHTNIDTDLVLVQKTQYVVHNLNSKRSDDPKSNGTRHVIAGNIMLFTTRL